jgi:hypothetical protein
MNTHTSGVVQRISPIHAPQPEAFLDYYNEHTALRLGEHPFHTTIATAIADRRVENSENLLLSGDSLRKLKNRNPPAGKSWRRPDDAPSCDDSPAGGVRRLAPQRRCRGGRSDSRPFSLPHVQLQRQ